MKKRKEEKGIDIKKKLRENLTYLIIWLLIINSRYKND